MKYALLFVLFFYVIGGYAQGYKRKKLDAFPKPPQFEKAAWYYGFGITDFVSIAHKKLEEGLVRNDSTFTTNSAPRGKIGAFAEFGRYHMIEKLYFFRYWNYGANYRFLRGIETFRNNVNTNSVITPIIAGENKFSDHYLNAHIEISGTNKLSDKTLLQHTIGGQVGFAVLAERTYQTNVLGIEQKTQSRLHSYLYYRIGWGKRVSNTLIVIPSLELPILNLYTFNAGRFDMSYFNSQYWPLTLSVRFLICKPYRLKNCTPVKAIGMPEDQEQPTEPK